MLRMMSDTNSKRCGDAISFAEFKAESDAQAELWRDAMSLFAEAQRIASERARSRARRRRSAASGVLFGGDQ